MTSMVEAIIDKYGPGDDESFDFIAVPRRRHQESTSSETSGNETQVEQNYLIYIKKNHICTLNHTTIFVNGVYEIV